MEFSGHIPRQFIFVVAVFSSHVLSALSISASDSISLNTEDIYDTTDVLNATDVSMITERHTERVTGSHNPCQFIQVSKSNETLLYSEQGLFECRCIFITAPSEQTECPDYSIRNYTGAVASSVEVYGAPCILKATFSLKTNNPLATPRVNFQCFYPGSRKLAGKFDAIWKKAKNNEQCHKSIDCNNDQECIASWTTKRCQCPSYRPVYISTWDACYEKSSPGWSCYFTQQCQARDVNSYCRNRLCACSYPYKLSYGSCVSTDDSEYGGIKPITVAVIICVVVASFLTCALLKLKGLARTNGTPSRRVNNDIGTNIQASTSPVVSGSFFSLTSPVAFATALPDPPPAYSDLVNNNNNNPHYTNNNAAQTPPPAYISLQAGLYFPPPQAPTPQNNPSYGQPDTNQGNLGLQPNANGQSTQPNPSFPGNNQGHINAAFTSDRTL